MGEDTKSNGSSLPLKDGKYPVPPSMRTARILPRAVAGILACAWIALFAYGTIALARLEETHSSPFDSLFENGRRHWAARADGKDSPCLAYFVSDFVEDPSAAPHEPGITPSSDPELHISGAMRLKIFESNALAHLTLNSGFNTFLKLDHLDAKMEIGKAKVHALSETGSPEIVLNLDAGSMRTSQTFVPSKPVYLSQKGQEKFTLRMPAEIETVLLRAHTLPRTGRDLEILESEAEFERCKAEVLDPSAAHDERLINLGPYLRLAQIGPEHDIVKVLAASREPSPASDETSETEKELTTP